jgi:hypothetical protein
VITRTPQLMSARSGASRIDGAELELTVADGEEIRTEISAEFTR